MPSGSTQNAGTGIEAWLSCFGKHPGWNDHIDDIGIETEFLTTAKRTLYVEGMSGNIDGGVWESYAEDERLEQFDHTIFSRTSSGLGAGRMWSSRDGKGRSKYPMIILAQTRHAPMAWLGSSVIDILLNVESRCKLAETSSAVIETLDEARRELRQLAQGVAPAASTPKAPPTAIERLAETSDLGPDAQGLLRVLYQVDRDCGPYLRQSRGDSGTKSRVFDIRPQSLRVPRCVPSPGESADLWMRLLYTVLDPATPLTVIVPEREDWVDIIVGVPNAAVLSCVKASTKKAPLTTEIPYTIDADFQTRVETLMRTHREGDPDAKVLGGDVDLGYLAGPGGPSVAKALQTIRDQAAGTRSLPLPILIGAGAGVLLLLVLVLVLVFGGSSDDDQSEANAGDQSRTTDRSSEPSARNNRSTSVGSSASSEDGTPPTVIGDETQQAWAYWVNAADQWLLEFLNTADLDGMREDSHLASTVVPAIETLRSGDVEPHPARFAGDRPSRLTDLIAKPPSRLSNAGGRSAAQAVVGAIRQIDDGLESWHARSSANSILERIDASTQFAGLLRERLGAINPEEQTGRSLSNGIGAMQEIAPALDTLGSLYPESRRLSHELRETQEPLLVQSSEVLADLPGILDTVTTQAQLLESAELAASWLNAANLAMNRYRLAYSGIDPELFESQAPSYRALQSDGASDVVLGQWAEQVRDPRYAALAQNLDPRSNVRGMLQDANESLSNVRSRHGRDATPLLESKQISESLSEIVERLTSIAEQDWKHSTREQIELASAEMADELVRIEHSLWTIDTELSTSAEELLAQIDQHRVIRPDAPPALNSAWQRLSSQARAEFDANQDLPVLRDWYESALPRLERVANAVAVPRAFGRVSGVSDPAAVFAAIQDAGRAEADRVVSDFLESSDVVSMDPGRFDSEVDELATTLESWRDEVTTYVAAVFEAEAQLRGLVDLDEATAPGETLRERFDRLQSARFSGDDLVSPIVRPAMHAFDEAESAEQSSSLDDLVALASDPETHPGVSWAAWNAAVESGLADLSRARGALDVQRRLISSLGDQARRERLGTQLEAQAVAVWQAAVQTAGSWTEFYAIKRRASEFGVDASSMSEHDRARSLFLELAALIERGPALGDNDQADALAMVRHLREQSATIGWPEFTAVMDELTPLLDGSDTGPVFDPSAEGPGALGWASEASPDTQLIRYTWSGSGGQATTLEFRALPSGSSGESLPQFIMTREVSVADVIAILDSTSAWELSREALVGGTDDARVLDPREGPRSWEWTDLGEPEQRLVPARSWLAEHSAGIAPYPEGVDPGTPAYESPMQWIPARTALWLASRIGCRLPTSTEWRSAHDAFPDSTPPNRRDFRWDQQREHAIDQESQRRLPRYPDEEVFRASRDGVAVGRDAQSVTTEDDGTLWFAPVTDGPAWIGNVAELVTSRATNPDTDPDTLEGWSELIRSGGLGVSVIGGSALSGPETDPMQGMGLSIRRADNGYSDVGFRLAITVGQAPRPHWTVLAGALLDQVTYPQ